MKGIKSHAGHNGCMWYQVVEQCLNSRVVYLKIDASPRTAPEFKQMIYIDY